MAAQTNSKLRDLRRELKNLQHKRKLKQLKQEIETMKMQIKENQRIGQGLQGKGMNANPYLQGSSVNQEDVSHRFCHDDPMRGKGSCISNIFFRLVLYELYCVEEVEDNNYIAMERIKEIRNTIDNAWKACCVRKPEADLRLTATIIFVVRGTLLTRSHGRNSLFYTRHCRHCTLHVLELQSQSRTGKRTRIHNRYPCFKKHPEYECPSIRDPVRT